MITATHPELMTPLRRTFAAAEARTEEERQRLNLDTLTSQYMTGSPYVVRKPFVMSDGSLHPRQPYTSHTFRTKAEAQLWIEANR